MKNQSEYESKITNQRIPTPVLPHYIEGKLPLKLNINKDKFNMPEDIKIIGIKPTLITQTKATNVASTFDGNPEFSTFQGLEKGTIYIWRSNLFTLMIYPSTNSFKYNLTDTTIPSIPNNRRMSQDNIKEKAITFLIDHKILSKDDIVPISVNPLVINGLSEGFQSTTENKASIFQVNFSYKILNRQIFSNDYASPLIYVRLLPDGTVYSMEANLLGEIQEDNKTVILKNYEDIQNSLDQAVLIGFQNDYINVNDINISDVQEISIDTISLVYLKDKASAEVLQPVYLLEGKAKVRNSSVNYAQLYLQAAK
jgi:hypothetical protein